MTYMMGAFSK